MPLAQSEIISMLNHQEHYCKCVSQTLKKRVYTPREDLPRWKVVLKSKLILIFTGNESKKLM